MKPIQSFSLKTTSVLGHVPVQGESTHVNKQYSFKMQRRYIITHISYI